MHLSLGQAAKATGMDKSTISRAIKSGKLSATRQENGGYAIDPAEVFRVFAPASKDTEQPRLARDTVLDGWSEPQALRMQLEAATLRLQDKDEEIRDLRHRLDTEGEERRKLTMMLLASHHAEPPQAHESPPGEAVSMQRPPPQSSHPWQLLLPPSSPGGSGPGAGGGSSVQILLLLPVLSLAAWGFPHAFALCRGSVLSRACNGRQRLHATGNLQVSQGGGELGVLIRSGRVHDPPLYAHTRAGDGSARSRDNPSGRGLAG